jgi:hypothetical protein
VNVGVADAESDADDGGDGDRQVVNELVVQRNESEWYGCERKPSLFY